MFFVDHYLQEDVPDFLKKSFEASPKGCEDALQAINELYTKYKFMEAKLLQQKRSMIGKIPEIEAALDTLDYLEQKDEEVPTTFELSDSAYVQATITKSDSVLLWLGANVMVEYPRDEAKEMLTTNLATAKKSLDDLKEHLDYLKDQITISEVNVARIHNYKVELQQTLKAAA